MINQSNDSGNAALKVCSNRNTITNEHKVVIIGDSHSRGCTMRMKHYLNNKI
jgi:hypothetical protein